jgi:hypothetical protein
MIRDITVSIYIADTPQAARDRAPRVNYWDCPPAAVPVIGDMVVARDDEHPHLVHTRVWAGSHAVALLVRRPAADTAVRRFLELSTAHLPKAVMADLNGYDGVVAHAYPHGAWLWVPEDPAEHAAGYGDPAEHDGVPAQVLVIQVYARAAGCDWVRLDADGDRNPELPHWNW